MARLYDALFTRRRQSWQHDKNLLSSAMRTLAVSMGTMHLKGKTLELTHLVITSLLKLTKTPPHLFVVSVDTAECFDCPGDQIQASHV